ncbi:heptaprenyl diphosphate synthase component 1 [Pontibacillus sp. ALD_SL1]|uniref:heptaprenyl diphosphate synthase component 1 n=1 Tax=Pontibacillus sp. ALD_SL1 TaxID=2777185 RepID=UPI001A97C0AB|nr:heptaprenyl diphosphate synthase component 1 [Pontibacillus sp. ALD_SL1]QSS98468.1 heptaprenyl diphosphate synthase component 1 [Pontibacillus sp. ALD_SL1]
MSVKDTNVNIEHLRTSIEHQIQHPYLAKYISDPVICEDKLMFLTSLLQDTDLSEDKQKHYIISTMLVQIALDTHELVNSSTMNEEDHVTKSRQLTVLAGDYYSGLYYYLLSKIEDLPMIHTLASAIKEINELKMKIYNQDFPSIAQVMDALKQVESLLIQRVAEFVNQPMMNEVAGDWLLAKRLQDEDRRFRKRENSPLIELLIKSTLVHQNGAQALRTIEKYMKKQMVSVEQSLTQLPGSFSTLKTYLQHHIYHSFYLKHQAVEEG